MGTHVLSMLVSFSSSATATYIYLFYLYWTITLIRCYYYCKSFNILCLSIFLFPLFNEFLKIVKWYLQSILYIVVVQNGCITIVGHDVKNMGVIKPVEISNNENRIISLKE